MGCLLAEPKQGHQILVSQSDLFPSFFSFRFARAKCINKINRHNIFYYVHRIGYRYAIQKWNVEEDEGYKVYLTAGFALMGN